MMVGMERGTLRIAMLTTEELGAEARASIIAVCIAAHNIEDFQHLFTFIPSGGRHFLAYRGDELVSHAVVTTRWAQPESMPPLKTAYVDAVATLPQQQGLGYASATMHALGDSVQDFDIGCLQTDLLGFYERFGWEHWRGPLSGRGDDGPIPTPDQRGVMILRLSRTPALDLDEGLSIERQPSRIWE